VCRKFCNVGKYKAPFLSILPENSSRELFNIYTARRRQTVLRPARQGDGYIFYMLYIMHISAPPGRGRQAEKNKRRAENLLKLFICGRARQI
jgi:hypothetical protein